MAHRESRFLGSEWPLREGIRGVSLEAFRVVAMLLDWAATKHVAWRPLSEE